MIALRDVTVHARRGGRAILAGVSLRMEPRERIGILAPSGGGKTTIARVMAGILRADEGEVTRTTSLSWPLTYSSVLHPNLTARANIRALAAMQHQEAEAIMATAAALIGPDAPFDVPLGDCPPGIRVRLSAATVLAFAFDTYLADEMPALPEGAFRDRFEAMLHQRMRRSGLLLLTRHAHLVRRYCTRAFVLHQGVLVECPRIEDAADLHEFATRKETNHAFA